MKEDTVRIIESLLKENTIKKLNLLNAAIINKSNIKCYLGLYEEAFKAEEDFIDWEKHHNFGGEVVGYR